MKKWQRRLRGALGTGLTWAMAWFGAGLVLLLIVGPDAADVPFPLGFGMLGFLAGATFSIILGFAGSGRRLEQMSIPRFAGWGGGAGLLLSGMFALVAALLGETTPLTHLPVLAPVFALAGAASAAGSLALARGARDRAALGSGPDAADARLHGAETRVTREIRE